MKTYVLDFETYYDTAARYSLGSKDMTTESYVRDPRFEAILLGIYDVDTGEAWAAVGEKEIRAELKALKLHKCAVAAHNNKFDGFILYDRYGIEPQEYICTLMMSRPLHGSREANSLAKLAKRYGLKDKGTAITQANGKRLSDFSPRELDEYIDYCLHDCALSWQLYQKFRPHYSKQDMITISDTLRAHCVPLLDVDVPLLQEYIPRLEKEQEQRLQAVLELVGYRDLPTLARDLRSGPKFAALLESLGYDVPMKESKTAKHEDGTPKQTYAFAKNDWAFKSMLDSDDETLSLLCHARIGEKSTINQTRAQRYIDIGQRGRMPFSLEPLNAQTTRWTAGAGDKTNMQNQSKRGGDTTLRQSLRAPKGFVVATCDLAQIEARRNAAHAGQVDVVEAFREGRDIYCEFATEVYGTLITKEDKQERTVGKEGVLSLGFKAWYPTFRTRLWTAYGIRISEDFAKEVVLKYRARMNKIVELWEICDTAMWVMVNGGEQFWFGAEQDYMAEKGAITLPDGWRMVYEDIQVDGEDDFGRPVVTYVDRVKRSRRRLTQGIICNNITQGSSARILQWQFAKIRGEGFPFTGTVHDEGIWVVPEDALPDLYDVVTYWMKRTPKWARGTPVDAEFSIGRDYGNQVECEDYDAVEAALDTMRRRS